MRYQINNEKKLTRRTIKNTYAKYLKPFETNEYGLNNDLKGEREKKIKTTNVSLTFIYERG